MSEPRKVVIGNATLYHGDCLEILPGVGPVQAIITDPPYSDCTHVGQRTDDTEDGSNRRPIDYDAWGGADIHAFARVAAQCCDGWIVAMCDHRLAPMYEAALQENGRYVFAPLPYFAAGSRVRLMGDGPSSWTVWIVVARTAAQNRWGTLPGGYVRQAGWDSPEKMGGKPVKLMEQLIRDYSKRDTIVCDPCMGRASTGVAALAMGRQFVGIERDATEFDLACQRIENAQRQVRMFA